MSGKASLPFVLKFKGNKTFSPFTANTIGEEKTLATLYSVCSKTREHLEEDRLENLAWRLWSLHTATVSTKKDRDDFKKLSRGVAEGLNKEKGRPIGELSAPVGRSDSGRLANRVDEKARARRASKDVTSKPTSLSSQSVGANISGRRDSPSGVKQPPTVWTSSSVSTSAPSLQPATLPSANGSASQSRAQLPQDFLLSSSTKDASHPDPLLSPWASSSSSALAHSAHQHRSNASSSGPHLQPPIPHLNSFDLSSHFDQPSQSDSPSQPPPETRIPISLDDIFALANSTPPLAPPQPPPRPSQPRYSYSSSSKAPSAELPLEEILRGFDGGTGNASTAGVDLGFDPWPADFNSLNFGESEGFSFDASFANSMAGIESSSLQAMDTLRPSPNATASPSYTTPTSAIASSASPEDLRQHMAGGHGEIPQPQHERVRRLSKLQEPFVGREEVGRGSSGPSGMLDGSDGVSGVVADAMMSPPALGQAAVQPLRSVPARRTSTSSQISLPARGRSRVPSFSSALSRHIPSDPAPSSVVNTTEQPSSKRRRGSDMSSEYSTSSVLITAPWSTSAHSPTSILLSPSTVGSPWNSTLTPTTNSLATGFQALGVGSPGLTGPSFSGTDQHRTSSGGSTGQGDRSKGGGLSRSASSSSSTARAFKSGQPPVSSTSHPYQPISSTPVISRPRAKPRTSSTSSASSQPFTSGASTPLTPYQLGFLKGIAPVSSSSSSPGPVRRASESQTARPSSLVRESLEEQLRLQQQLTSQHQHQQRISSQSMPVSPHRRPVGLAGVSEAGYEGVGGAGATRPPVRLSLQEQLELAGMVPRTSNWQS